MNKTSPLWIAQRRGQNWQDDSILSAITGLTSVLDKVTWSYRLDQVKLAFEAGKREWAVGKTAPLFDPQDAIAWYIFQAHAYAAHRIDWYEPEAYRIVPIFRRLGQILPQLRAMPGFMDRVQTLMTKGRSQPDDGLFELLVAGAYKCRSWNQVEFVSEQPGIQKTQDILVSTRRRRWGVECKRVNRSKYEARELALADELAAPVHKLCRNRGRSIVLEVVLGTELSEVNIAYLFDKVEAFLNDPSCSRWTDSEGWGRVRDIDWRMPQAVLQHDDIFFGSSRMVELLAGRYEPSVNHSVAGDWDPAPERPLFATSMRQASVVSWKSASADAAISKAKHFKSIVANAAKQLPEDCPGVIHVGYEARGGNPVEALRHLANSVEIRTFDPEKARLRWVYGHYFTPEHTTSRNESLAVSETTVPYRVGRHRTAQPLPNNLLFSDESGIPGAHWIR